MLSDHHIGRVAGGVPTRTDTFTFTEVPECSSSITHADSCKCQ